MESEEDDLDFYDAEEGVANDPEWQEQQNQQRGRQPPQQRKPTDPLRRSIGKRRPPTTAKDSQHKIPTSKDHLSSADVASPPELPVEDTEDTLKREPQQQQPQKLDSLPPPNVELTAADEVACSPRLRNSQASNAEGKTACASASIEVSDPTGNTTLAETTDLSGGEIEQTTQAGCDAENNFDDRIGASLSIAQASNLGSGMSVNGDGTTLLLKNLDTNQMVPLSEVEEELRSHGIDPLSLHMLKRTKSAGAAVLLPTLDITYKHDSDDSDSDVDETSRKGRPRILKFLKRSSKEKKGGWKGESDQAGSKGKSDSGGASHISSGKESVASSSVPNDNVGELEQPSRSLGHAIEYPYIKVKVRHKRNKQLGRLFLCQELVPPWDLGEAGRTAAGSNPGSSLASTSQPQLRQSTMMSPLGAVWTMKFSKDGKYLATGGQDTVVHVWSLVCEGEPPMGSATPPVSAPVDPETQRGGSWTGPSSKLRTTSSSTSSSAQCWRTEDHVFHSTPLREYHGHTADVLDLSWSKNNFLLSSSMDKTVRLWHVTRQECLCCFQHPDFVTAITFHPRDDRFFLSGSLDCKLRLWNIPDKKVTCWNESPENLITAVGFTLDGKIAVAGSYVGLCMFYETENLKYNTQIHVKASSRGAKGRKITGIEPMPGMPPGEEKLLITSNDSRIRLYNMRDKSLECKFKGLENTSSQIRAAFSDDGRYIICGSEDRHVYVWDTDLPGMYGQRKGSSTGVADTNESHSRIGQSGLFSKGRGTRGMESFEAHSQIVTVAVFAPTRTKQLLATHGDRLFGTTAALTHGNADPESLTYPDGNVIVSADYTGCIRVFRNDPMPRFAAGSDGDSVSVRSKASSIKNIILNPRQGLRFLQVGSMSASPAGAAPAPVSPLSWPGSSSNSTFINTGALGGRTSSPPVPKAASLNSLESSASLRRTSALSSAGSVSGQRIIACPACGSADLRGFSVLDERRFPGQMVVCAVCNKVVSGI